MGSCVFLAEISHLGRGRLHAVRQLEARQAGGQFGVVGPGQVMGLVFFSQAVKQMTLVGRCHARRQRQVVDGGGGRAQNVPLIGGGHIAT